MKNITVSISDDLAEKMDKLRGMNWSEVCGHAIWKVILAADQAEEVERIKSEISKP